MVAQRSPVLGPGILVRPLDPEAPNEQLVAGSAPTGAEMITLEPDRRARLVAFVQGSERMPPEAKSRILGQLEGETVPAEMVARLESQMES